MVLGSPGLGREAADLLDHRPRHHRAAVDRVGLQELREVDLVAARAVALLERPVGAAVREEEVRVARNDSDAGLALLLSVVERNLLFQEGRLPEVVGIEEREQLAARLADRDVSGARRPDATGCVHDLQAVSEASRDFDRVVSGAVVGEDDLPVIERLRPNRRKGLGEVRSRVVGRGDDADAGHGRSVAVLYSSACGT